MRPAGWRAGAIAERTDRLGVNGADSGFAEFSCVIEYDGGRGRTSCGLSSDLGGGRATMCRLTIVIAFSMVVASGLAAQSPSSCDQWNTGAFFGTATVEDVARCLTAGADVNARDEAGRTPLHGAVGLSGYPTVVEILLAAGADPNARTADGSTPLHWAAGLGRNPAVVEALLAAGADIEARCELGRTPLHEAADPEFWLTKNENLPVVETLLKAGANPNARDEGGSTPLYGADLMNEHPAVVEALLEAGADPRHLAR